ncbi:probable G-protein coupled receptor B0563.6 [Homarus americanus]|nr:probable G-protein coupled receptor B0563.6 [Homarus americanus]
MQSFCHCLTIFNMTEGWQTLQNVCQVSYKQIFPFILMLAAVTNIINVAVLLRPVHRASRTTSMPTRTHLVWLGLSHCVLCVTVTVALIVRKKVSLVYTWAFYLAHLEEPIYNMFNCSCAFIILGVSTDRYQAVCSPHKYSATLSYHKMPGRVALAYTVSAVMYFPSCFSQAPQYSDHHQGWYITKGAIFDTRAWMIWSVSLEVLHRFLPCALLVVLNLQILRAVVRLKFARTSVRTTARAGGSRCEQKIIYLLLTLTLTFLVINLPVAVLKTTYLVQGQHCHTNVTLEVVRSVTNCLELAGICSDFFLYFLMNPEYRRDVHSLMLCVFGLCGCCSSLTNCCPLQDSPDPHPTTT